MPCHMTIYIVHSVDVPIQLEHSTSPLVDALHSHLQAEEEEERASGFEQLLPSLLLLDVVFQLLVYYALADPSLSSSQFPRNLLALCGWNRNVDCKRLCCCLMEVMKESPNIYIDSTPCGNTPWQRPRPSVTAYQIVRCLNLVCRCKGWAWTNDFLIAKHLWPILQQWNGKTTGAGSAHDDDVVRDCVVVCILRLIGKLCGCVSVASMHGMSSIFHSSG